MRSISALVGALAYRVGLPVQPASDHFDRFVATLRPAPGHSEGATEMWIAYQQWCLLNAEAPTSRESFGRAMASRLAMTRPRQERRFLDVKAAHS